MKTIILAVLGITIVFMGRSQISSEEEIANLTGANIPEMESWQNINQVIIQQIGDNNKIISLQQNSGIYGTQILSSQQGNGNSGYIRQSGDDHKTTLRQTGQNSVANLWQEGNFTDFEAWQTGAENIINSYIKNAGLFEKTAFLLQDGNNNRIDLAIFGNENPTAAQSIKITQQGNGFEARALMESYNLPIQITQKAGSGEGQMKINISTSYFNFPMKQ
jgi:hypothetical protein